MENPFHVGQMVVCIKDEWDTIEGPPCLSIPKKGQVLPIFEISGDYLGFKGFYAANGGLSGFHYHGFAPVQDATNLEFSDAEIEEEIETIQHKETAEPCPTPYIL